MDQKKFKVLLLGRNVLMLEGSQPRRMGFYTTRFVTATDISEAIVKAIGLVEQDSELREAIRNEIEDPPRIEADKVAEINYEISTMPNRGYSFFSEEEED